MEYCHRWPGKSRKIPGDCDKFPASNSMILPDSLKSRNTPNFSGVPESQIAPGGRFRYNTTMSKKDKYPVTAAIRLLKSRGIPFEVLPYKYVERGGTKSSSEQLGVDEHLMVKTLIMETDTGDPLIVLMHGDKEVSTKNLAREIGAKSVRPCDPAVADKHSGYFVGGTSPFGTRRAMPVYAEATIFDLDEVFLNAGHRGLMLRMRAADIEKALEVTRVEVGIGTG